MLDKKKKKKEKRERRKKRFPTTLPQDDKG